MREIFEPMNSVMAAGDDAERESEADGGGEKTNAVFLIHVDSVRGALNPRKTTTKLSEHQLIKAQNQQAT
jgi:hypothetical protein